ncbi:MAG: hypothetical protein H6712_31220 [Myxococcales bacterium]|nr:hypothetical protein [Myxococcales bacterium]MCB9718362.1 hypothetical protein [Myxococcales bacterium]
MSRPSPAVVLCCATENRTLLGHVLERLGAQGLKAETVSGVDLDASRLRDAIRRNGSGALFVLCRSDELDLYQCTHLYEVLEGAEVSRAHVLDVSLGSDRPDEMVRAIADAARRVTRNMAPSLPEPPPVGGGSAGLGMARAVPRPAGAVSRGSMPPPPPLGGGVAVPRVGATAAMAVPAPSSVPTRPPPSLPRTRPVSATSVSPIAPAPLDESMRHVLSPNSIADDSQPVELRASPGRRWAIGLGSLVALALVVGGLASSGGEEPEEPAADRGPVEVAEAVPTEVEGAGAQEGLAVEAAEGEAAEGEPASGPPGRGEPIERSPSPTDALDAPEPEPTVEQPPGDALAIGSEAEDEKITEAIRGRRIRALDLLLIDPKRLRRGTYDKALEHCASRGIDGVTGWRLPTVGEARVLTSNEIVPKDYYWTLTKGDTFGSQQLVWNGRRRKIQVSSPHSKKPRAICVRDRQGSEPDLADR